MVTVETPEEGTARRRRGDVTCEGPMAILIAANILMYTPDRADDGAGAGDSGPMAETISLHPARELRPKHA